MRKEEEILHAFYEKYTIDQHLIYSRIFRAMWEKNSLLVQCLIERLSVNQREVLKNYTLERANVLNAIKELIENPVAEEALRDSLKQYLVKLLINGERTVTTAPETEPIFTPQALTSNCRTPAEVVEAVLHMPPPSCANKLGLKKHH